MSLPNSLSAYRDCEDLYQKAALGAKGGRAKVPTYESAINLRTRLHYYRVLDRQANKLVYPDPGDPMHGQSSYDDFVVQLFADEDGDGWWVYITKRSANILVFEPLGEEDTVIEATATEVRAIEDQTTDG